jgi:hypothetical protein
LTPWKAVSRVHQRRRVELREVRARGGENDGLIWPRCDGLNWPHLRPIVT